MLSPTSAVLEQEIAVRDIVTNEGVDVRDFASPEALADKSSDAFTEYAHHITTTHNLRTSANTALRSLLRGVSSKTEDRLAEEILSSMTTVFKINLALHLRSIGRRIHDPMIQQEEPWIGNLTNKDAVLRALSRQGTTLPPDFSWPLLQRLHRFASGLETGTIQHGDNVLTIEHDASDETDLCRIMEHPQTVSELRASKALWSHSTPLRHVVRGCVEDVSRLIELDRNTLELPKLATTVWRSKSRKRRSGNPYDAPRTLRYLESMTSPATHVLNAVRRTSSPECTDQEPGQSSQCARNS